MCVCVLAIVKKKRWGMDTLAANSFCLLMSIFLSLLFFPTILWISPFCVGWVFVSPKSCSSWKQVDKGRASKGYYCNLPRRLV